MKRMVWMKQVKMLMATAVVLFAFMGCQKEAEKAEKTVWIYTSLYKDTIADLTPKLKAAFPGVKVEWFQAGSEEISAKVNAEILAGKIQADLIICSDRFWFEELAGQNRLHSYSIKNAVDVDDVYKHPSGLYTTLSIPVMVMTVNKESLKPEAWPKSFKDLTLPTFAEKVSSGSPLSSGTTFTTMAMLQEKYGWDYFNNLKKNKIIMEGGNSAVVRRLQSSERPIGIVLLENILRFKTSDPRLQFIIPDDGVIIHNNVLGIVKKEDTRQDAEQIAEWLFAEEGQKAMVRSYMYSPKKGFAAPEGAPAFEQIAAKAFPFNADILSKVAKERNGLKEKFTQIMYQ